MKKVVNYTEHNWRAIPHDEAQERRVYFSYAPYLWECRRCYALVHTKTEPEPDFFASDAPIPHPVEYGKINNFHVNCDMEIVKGVMES